MSKVEEIAKLIDELESLDDYRLIIRYCEIQIKKVNRADRKNKEWFDSIKNKKNPGELE